MKTKIHGMTLPKAVTDFLTEGADTILDYKVLNHVFGVTLGMNLRCHEQCLEKETLALRRLQKDEIAPFYGLKQGASRDSKFLDADYCLCLGANLDEEGICLDYRECLDSPSVILSTWRDQPNEHTRWILAAESFESFIEKYKGEQAAT